MSLYTSWRGAVSPCRSSHALQVHCSSLFAYFSLSPWAVWNARRTLCSPRAHGPACSQQHCLKSFIDIIPTSFLSLYGLTFIPPAAAGSVSNETSRYFDGKFESCSCEKCVCVWSGGVCVSIFTWKPLQCWSTSAWRVKHPAAVTVSGKIPFIVFYGNKTLTEYEYDSVNPWAISSSFENTQLMLILELPCVNLWWDVSQDVKWHCDISCSYNTLNHNKFQFNRVNSVCALAEDKYVRLKLHGKKRRNKKIKNNNHSKLTILEISASYNFSLLANKLQLPRIKCQHTCGKIAITKTYSIIHLKFWWFRSFILCDWDEFGDALVKGYL